MMRSCKNNGTFIIFALIILSFSSANKIMPILTSIDSLDLRSAATAAARAVPGGTPRETSATNT